MKILRPSESKSPEAIQNTVNTPTLVMQDALRKMLSTFAIETWRIRRKLSRLHASAPDEEMAGLSVSLDRIDSCLCEFGLECKEYDNQIYDDGLNVRVLDYEERPDFSPGVECIVRTVAPGVLLQGFLIRQGEVVVARNLKGGESSHE
jgi:hypothetical protein